MNSAWGPLAQPSFPEKKTRVSVLIAPGVARGLNQPRPVILARMGLIEDEVVDPLSVLLRIILNFCFVWRLGNDEKRKSCAKRDHGDATLVLSKWGSRPPRCTRF